MRDLDVRRVRPSGWIFVFASPALIRAVKLQQNYAVDIHDDDRLPDPEGAAFLALYVATCARLGVKPVSLGQWNQAVSGADSGPTTLH